MRTPHPTWSSLMGLMLFVGACGGGSPTSAQPATAPPLATALPAATPEQTDVMSQPTVDGRFAVGRHQHELALRCFGRGTPTIVFEAGTDSSGLGSFPSALVKPLAETNMTCFYDRLGTGSSDPPTEPRRTLDDVVADTKALLAAANISPPYVLVGQSGGGNLVVWYAAKHPDEVDGLVLIEAGHDDPSAGADEFPGAQAWGGPEHIDWVDAARLEWQIGQIGNFPVLILTGDHGEEGPPPDQTYWRALSPDARQVVMHGGHDLHQEIPEDVANEIRSLLDLV